MAWALITGDFGIQNVYGPFEDCQEATDVAETLVSFQHKYIVELGQPERADIERVPFEWRERLITALMAEVEDMSTKELVFLMIEGMDMDELNARAQELQTHH